ncbi:MAG: hypothetical protein HXX81_01600 [Campylobacterales bacterium]|nr:hypothetical protein [Campylobacterales bacterium]
MANFFIAFVKKIKVAFKFAFRKTFLHHHESLEFRAKFLASLMLVDSKISRCEYELLEEISKQIYKDDDERATTLVNTTKEYITFTTDIEKLLINIYKMIQITPRYKEKIDFEVIKKFKECLMDKDDLEFYDKVEEFYKNI